MFRIEFAEASPSRRNESPTKSKPEKRPALLKRIFGSKRAAKPQAPAKGAKPMRYTTVADQEMLIV